MCRWPWRVINLTLNCIALVGSGDRSLWEDRAERAQRLCQRSALWCKYSQRRWAHDICLKCNGCWAAEAPVVVCTRKTCFGEYLHPEPDIIGCFCAWLLQSLQNWIVLVCYSFTRVQFVAQLKGIQVRKRYLQTGYATPWLCTRVGYPTIIIIIIVAISGLFRYRTTKRQT